jgi:ceramide glucosyltransferase
MSVIFAVFAVVSAVLGIPLHRRTGWHPPPGRHPGITVLKPIKGCDAATESCLRSWFEQDFSGPRQLLIGVASMADPVVPLAQRLIAEYPHWQASLVECAQVLGENAKVSILIQLQAQAVHEFLCVSDADVWAPPDFLRESLGMLDHSGAGLVNSFYEMKGGSGIGPRWEALATNADFWSQVLQAASLQPLDFALGAAMIFRRTTFERCGGFRPLADLLADDFHLGHALANHGQAIQLSPIVVECRSASLRFGANWLHQLRWARTIRSCRAWPYFLSLLSNATLWPLLWWATQPGLTTAVPVMLLLGLRGVQATLLEQRLTRRWNGTSFWMAWIKDALQLPIWVLAFTGNVVYWRGVSYRVDWRGKLTRLVVRTAAPRVEGSVNGRPAPRPLSGQRPTEIAAGQANKATNRATDERGDNDDAASPSSGRDEGEDATRSAGSAAGGRTTGEKKFAGAA